MAGKIKPGGFLFHIKAFTQGEVRQIRQEFFPIGTIIHAAEKAHLTGKIAFLFRIYIGKQIFVAGKHTAAIAAEGIQRAGFNKRFQSAFVKLAPENAAAEVCKVNVLATVFPTGYNVVYKPSADIFYRKQTEANGVILPYKAAFGCVYIRPRDFYAHLLALADIFYHLIGVIEYGAELRRHIFSGKMAFEIRGAVRNRGIRRRMGFIESV